MNELNPASAFKQAVEADDKLVIPPDTLAWFKARGTGWQNELNGVLEFYIHTAEHPASEPEPPRPGGSAPILKV
jgi:BrnA antitoxin of type II toxin-antitoxin system